MAVKNSGAGRALAVVTADCLVYRAFGSMLGLGLGVRDPGFNAPEPTDGPCHAAKLPISALLVDYAGDLVVL